MLENFKALIHGYPNSTKLNKTQLTAFENFKDVIDEYIDKD